MQSDSKISGGLNGNGAAAIGGGLSAENDIALANTVFISNTADAQGGGLYAGSAVSLSGGKFERNATVSSSGGGLFLIGGLSVSGTQFVSNTAAALGGGVYASGAADATNALFQSNRSLTTQGGGLYAVGALALTGTQWISNTATGYGGGAYALGARGKWRAVPGQPDGRLRRRTVCRGRAGADGHTVPEQHGERSGRRRVRLECRAAQRRRVPAQRQRDRFGRRTLLTGTLSVSGTQFISNTASFLAIR